MDYAPIVRRQFDSLYNDLSLGSAPRSTYYGHLTDLIESFIASIPRSPTQKSRDVIDLFDSWASRFLLDSEDPTIQYSFPSDTSSPLIDSTIPSNKGTTSDLRSPARQSPQSIPDTGTALACPQKDKPVEAEIASEPQKVEADACCEICGYRPKGDPQWFKGSMAKHKKLQHSKAPPRIYKCPYPGCTSQYKNRPDNLRQHQLDKGHFVDGENASRRPNKRKKVE